MQLIGSTPKNRELVRLIGSGGMGVVYEAMDTRLQRRVALKVLHPHLTVQESMRQRLLKEAQLAARVEHEGVVRIYNIHEDEGGLCLEMQYVEGVPLTRLLAVRKFSSSHAADLLRQVLEALVACHAEHVVHGDLKPGNLLVTPEGKVMIADFGISRAIFPDGEAEIASVSLSGPMWGTPQYCPPEAWEGASPDTSWDLYALGVLMYETLCGTLPFNAETPAMLMREKLDNKQISIAETRADLSPELAALIDALKADAPGARPDSATRALEELCLAPEFQQADTTTGPFRHNEESPTADFLLPMGMTSNSPLPEYILASTKRFGASWKLHLTWIVVLTLSLAPFYQSILFPAPPEPAIIPEGMPGKIMSLYTHRGGALFSYDDGVYGRELWAANSNGQAEIARDINPGPGSSNPGLFLDRRSPSLLFTAMTPSEGTEPWICSLFPPHSPRLLQDLIPGPMRSNPIPLTSRNDLFYFFATTLDHGQALWVTDAHLDRTGLVRELNAEATLLSSPANVVYTDSTEICFTRNGDGSHHLMRYDLAENRMDELGEVGRNIRDMKLIGNLRVFSALRKSTGMELWVQDDVNGIRLLKDIWPGSKSGDPEEFFLWKNAVYFRASSSEHGRELWKTDGTPEGTVEVSDVVPGEGNSSPYGFVDGGKHLFFRAYHLDNGDELWATDGRVGSNTHLFDIRPGAESSRPYSLAIIGKFLFFSADDGAHGEELWGIDPSDLRRRPFLVKDLRPGSESAEPHSLKALDDDTGIFVYKTGQGDGLMRLETGGPEIVLIPYVGLASKLASNR